MGKRELFIIIAFVALGAVAYQLTAPPPKPGERGFSLTRMFSGIRREISANASSATVTRTGTVKVRPGVTEVRVRALRRVPITITGERRSDIAYELPVESTGPDESTAKAWAERTELREDDLGGAIALWLFFPDEGTQTAKLVLRVPDHLTVRIEGSEQVQVSGVAAVNLFNLSGEATLSGITGAVTGNHRTGDLNVTGAGSVDLTLASSRAKFRDVSGGLSLSGRNGDCSVARSKGTIDATFTNVEFDVSEHTGSIKVGGDGGRLKVTLPTGDLSVDARRMVVVADAVGAGGRDAHHERRVPPGDVHRRRLVQD